MTPPLTVLYHRVVIFYKNEYNYLGVDTMLNIKELLNNYKKAINIDTTITYEEEKYKLMEILTLSEISVTGEIVSNQKDIFNMLIDIKGMMELPCAITLEPVPYVFNIEVSEIITLNNSEEDYIQINEDFNFNDFIYGRIITEMPLRIVSDKAEELEFKGENWSLEDEDADKSKEIDPRLADLQKLFKED